ncbi:MAG: cofactor-independent phosphoglycerate mutase [Syntrophales bacterium]|jgi:2,3-bisphosphoglycerate-independent phosphoglycerate mutase|nr:cofactor-independent phosphoglycerate mutase [Syntrophales bacterium]MDD4339176.1 cofactor-independent phosphoglycerate mutase [Syntrophales bacterium]
MKYAVLLGDGMADEPLHELNGRTPLEAAHTPYMDRIAAQGTLGLLDTIPDGFTPGSDVANLSVLGYDPRECYTGRGAIEAANMGVSLGPSDVAFRCNLVTLSDDASPVMEDFTAGHISTKEAGWIIRDLGEALSDGQGDFFAGVSYRHLYVRRNGNEAMRTTPPHDIVGQPIDRYVPAGKGAGAILEIADRARGILRDHPVNRERRRQSRRPANAIWPWGQGRAPKIEKMTAKYRISGGMISAVDLLNGMGIYAGLEVFRVPGATGYIDTDYEAKARTALEILDGLDFVFLHVEAPDEMGHEGNLTGKIRAIEDFDARIVGPVMNGLERGGPFRLLVLSDHPTPIRLRTHAADPTPFAVLSSLDEENQRRGVAYGETAARANGLMVSPGYILMDAFIRDWRRFIDRASN